MNKQSIEDVLEWKCMEYERFSAKVNEDWNKRIKKKKVFNFSSAQKEIHTGEWGPECLKSWTKGRLGPLGKLQSINPVHQNPLKWLQIGLQMTLEASRPL